MSSCGIVLEKREPKALITINNPDRLNALTHGMMRELAAVLKDAGSDENIRVVVLTGAGEKSFACGADISRMEEMTPVQLLKELPDIQEAVRCLEVIPKPVIARVNGIALGGGTELCLACDFRIASENAVFGLPEVKLGIIPGYGGTQRLPRLIGIARAKKMLFTGDKVSAQDALQIGLVDDVVAYDQLDEAVEAYVKKLSALPPLSLRFLKEAVQVGMQTDLESAIRMEARLFACVFGSEDRIEGVRAFLEKREARFLGK